MYKGYNVVVVTPAGRRRYMELLARHVLRSPVVDEWKLWVNTENKDDITYMEKISHERVQVSLTRGNWLVNGNYSIVRFYKGCNEPNTVYIRIDDDVVWFEDDAIEKLIQSRVQDLIPPVVYGTIFNCPVLSPYYQNAKLVSTKHGVAKSEWTDEVGWGSGAFARELHHAFLKSPHGPNWYLHTHDLDPLTRMSVNVISWVGGYAEWTDTIDGDEEASLSCYLPRDTGRNNRVIGDALFVHYAFFPQREVVDEDANILNGYKRLAGLK